MSQPANPKGRAAADDLLVTFLARGYTKAQAARATGVAVRTVFRRVADPAFAARVREARRELLDAVMGRLATAAGDAALTLATLVAPSAAVGEKVKVAASKSVIELMTRLLTTVELTDRLEELERLVAEKFGDRK
jgi:hypothetical protein